MYREVLHIEAYKTLEKPMWLQPKELSSFSNLSGLGFKSPRAYQSLPHRLSAVPF